RFLDDIDGAIGGKDWSMAKTGMDIFQPADGVLMPVRHHNLVHRHLAQNLEQFRRSTARPSVNRQPVDPLGGCPRQRAPQKAARHANCQNGTMLLNVNHRLLLSASKNSPAATHALSTPNFLPIKSKLTVLPPRSNAGSPLREFWPYDHR